LKHLMSATGPRMSTHTVRSGVELYFLILPFLFAACYQQAPVHSIRSTAYVKLKPAR
jgi:hypothetical protein